MLKREQLQKYLGTRETFTGRFIECGIAYDRNTRKYSRTVLLREIVSSTGEPVIDHAWIKPENETYRKYEPGELISFKAGIEKGISGYREKKRLVGNKDTELGYTFANIEIIPGEPGINDLVVK